MQEDRVLKRKRAEAFLFIIGWVALFPTEALAYLDPGTGSLIVQSLIAALAAVGFGLRHYWGRIRGWFTRSKPSAHSNDGPPESKV